MSPSNRTLPSLFIALFLAVVPHTAPAQDSATNSSLATTLRLEAIALENGEGVARNPALAITLYCKSARLGDAQAQYNLGWMYANGRGVARNDITAAYFFQAAAEQGLSPAQDMLKVVGGPTTEVPDCMREPGLPTSAVSPAKAAKPSVDYQAIAPRKILDMVMRMAPQFMVEPQLALAIISAESSFNSLARSPKNAQGLMQLHVATSARFNVKDAFDAEQNIRGGLAYLRWLLAYFQGDVALVAAAYNAGEGNVERHRGVPPFPETRNYVQKILKAVGARAHPFDATVTKPSRTLANTRSWLKN